VSRPGAEDGTDRAKHSGEVGGLLFQQDADVRARSAACAALRGDLRDFAQGQPEAAGLRDKGEQTENVDGVNAIAGRGTVGTRDDAARLVQSQRFAGDSTAPCYLTNEQAICHAMRIDLDPYDKVKGLLQLL
jgi:hypothetical protein